VDLEVNQELKPQQVRNVEKERFGKINMLNLVNVTIMPIQAIPDILGIVLKLIDQVINSGNVKQLTIYNVLRNK
jgi:hypothetical protein